MDKLQEQIWESEIVLAQTKDLCQQCQCKWMDEDGICLSRVGCML